MAPPRRDYSPPRPGNLHRTISDVLRIDGFAPNPHAHLPVYKTIHRIRRLILASIDDPYTLEQLRGPRLNVSIVRPLIDRLFDEDDVSVVYCLLVNRSQFLREQQYKAHHTVNSTRATLCELLAYRVLRKFHESNPSRKGLLVLANVLVAGFEPFQNAPPEVIRDSQYGLQWVQKRGGYERKLTALEIAIITESKAFLSSTACQRVVDAVYVGRIVYTPSSFIDLIPDHYKHKGISLYDPKRAGLLNQYRLIVPRTRNIIEALQFLVLVFFYVMTMLHRDYDTVTGWEMAFMVYGAGWVLDEFASFLEHGWHVHTQNLWSFLDVAFIAIYTGYMAIRIYGISVNNEEAARQALDVLACGAPILLPRLAFNLMPENMAFIALRAMMRDFIVLTLLAVWCFGGFLLAMRWLSRWSSTNVDDEQVDSVTISKWMLWIWFGLDGTGIQRSTDFHLVFGPMLMVAFAFLGNTLFLTILVSMLSNTFSKLVANATDEIMFRRAVLTFEGVKSDAIFAYRPPFNILALMILLPLKFVLTPRWFHKVNITAVRVLNFPLLLAINLWERQRLWKPRRPLTNPVPIKKNKSVLNLFSGFSVHGDIQAVFEEDPPQEIIDEIEDEDRSVSPAEGLQMRRRRFSSIVPRD
ncbi:hypothetical protein EJ06DRAFT_538195 [Trichodelitschia bisporula]|uniref:Receptor-activated Ca2+-permeable cation channel n=1 Tax=Trichodelitschia bisporula TaxID=703511 RepID=A0A6G1HVC5_9PEZI|nr:hypothetical protein EJ06DRAFT_538195 [Trichodelitschia bisporula]